MGSTPKDFFSLIHTCSLQPQLCFSHIYSSTSKELLTDFDVENLVGSFNYVCYLVSAGTYLVTLSLLLAPLQQSISLGASVLSGQC